MIDIFAVNIEKQIEICNAVEIKTQPTFKFFKDGQEVCTIEGADTTNIMKAIEKIC